MSEATDAPPAPAGGLGAPPPGAAPAAGRPPRSVLREAAAGVRRPLAAAMLLRSGHQVFEAFVPVLVGVVVDRAVDGGSATALGGWIAVLVADFLALSLCFRFGSRATVAAAEEAAHALRVRLSGRLLAPGHTAGRDRLPGELMSVAVSDTQQIGRFAAFAVQGVSAVVALALGAALLLRMSVPLGLLVLLGTPAVLVAMNRLGRPLERRGAAEQAAAARAAGTAVDYVAGLRVLKGLRAEAPAYARYAQANRASLRATVTAARFEALLDGAAVLLGGVLVTAVAFVAGHLAMDGRIGLGDLVACTGLCQFLIGPTQSLMSVPPDAARARASAGRVAALLEQEPPERESSAVPDVPRPASGPVTGALEIDRLSYGRLRGVTLAAGAGEQVGLVVPDPGAAAELLGCLRGDLLPDTGDVRLDGAPLRSWSEDGKRAAVLVVPHQPFLFDGTVLDNVRSGWATDPGPAGALAGLLPAPPGTRVGERGAFLSGGQRQRVLLARALHADPPVLVLDEPTTAVDPVTESRMARTLRLARRGRTTFVLTSSPILLGSCDRVVLIMSGAVAAAGPHAVLAATEPAYRAAVFG